MVYHQQPTPPPRGTSSSSSRATRDVAPQGISTGTVLACGTAAEDTCEEDWNDPVHAATRRGSLMQLELEPEALYKAVLARDRRFDGRFFVAVRTTRIYCRPICTVRPPRFENCRFHATAALAERAGYRPCLRCRPELAPGTCASVDAVSRLAGLALRRIEDGGLSRMKIDQLAEEFGVTARHLRRVIQQETGLSPRELAQTQRLLQAKQLLTDTTMSITTAAFAAGFESVRRFNTAFKAHYRMTPSSLRRSTLAQRPDSKDAYEFDLAVRPPFDWPSLLAFWERRAIAGVEDVAEGGYRRTVFVGNNAGWIGITPGVKTHTIRVVIAKKLAADSTTLLARLKGMLDVRAEPAGIMDRLAQDPLLAPLVERWPGLRLPGGFDGFEWGIRTIIGQQISVRGATTLVGRLAQSFGNAVATPFARLTIAFPQPAKIAETSTADLQSIGMTKRRAETIRQFARKVADGEILLEPGVDPEQLRARLLELPGIGEWTVEYLLLRALGWPDAFPASDLGLLKASGLSAAELKKRSANWQPWRGYAAMLLWQSLTADTVAMKPGTD